MSIQTHPVYVDFERTHYGSKPRKLNPPIQAKFGGRPKKIKATTGKRKCRGCDGRLISSLDLRMRENALRTFLAARSA